MFVPWGEGIRSGRLAVYFEHIISYIGLKYEQQIKTIWSSE